MKMIVLITVVLITLELTATALVSNSSNCGNVCENRLYEIATTNGWRLGSGKKMLWYVRRIDDYPSVLIINYDSHVMLQLNWTSMKSEETHDCSNMTLLKLEEHPTLRGCFILASQNEDVYFMLQTGGKLHIVNGSLTNQLLSVQDLRCFNYKQTLTTPIYPEGCDESAFLTHKSNQDIMTYSRDTSTSIPVNGSTFSSKQDSTFTSHITPDLIVQQTSRAESSRKPRREKLTVAGTNHFLVRFNNSEQTGPMPHIIRGIFMRTTKESSTTMKTTVEQSPKNPNTTSMQYYSSSAIGSMSIRSSTVFTPKFINGTNRYTIHLNNSEHTGTTSHITRGTTMSAMKESIPNMKTTVEQSSKKFNLTNMQYYSSSPIGSTSIRSSTIFTPKSIDGTKNFKGTNRFTIHFNNSEHTGTMPQITRGTSMSAMNESITSVKTTTEQSPNKFNITSMQYYSSSPIGLMSIRSSSIFSPMSINGELNSIPTDKSLPIALKSQFIQTTQLYSNLKTARVRKIKYKTTKRVIFHYNTKYLRKNMRFCDLIHVHCPLHSNCSPMRQAVSVFIVGIFFLTVYVGSMEMTVLCN